MIQDHFRENERCIMIANVRNKQRILRLLKYLYQSSDEDHPVTTKELVEKFSEENANAGRKTVKDDIDVLVDEGYDIVTNKSYYNSFFMGSREFELPELKLLIDAVSSSRFITQEKSDQLISKLSGFASKYEAEKLVRHIYTADRLKSSNSGIYYIVDRITDSINEEKKVRFQYFDYTPDKVKVLRHDGEAYIVSPYALLWDDNHYYMVGYYDKRKDINVFRVDRINNLEIIDDNIIPAPDSFNIDDYAQQVFNMFSGEKQEVVLQCHNVLMKSVIDQFGEDVVTWKISEDQFRVKAYVCTSQTFYGWIFQFAGKMKIISPDRAVEEYKNMLEKALTHMSL